MSKPRLACCQFHGLSTLPTRKHRREQKFLSVLASEHGGRPQTSEQRASKAISSQLISLSRRQQHAFVVKHLHSEILGVLGTADDLDFSPEQTLMDLGVDSLVLNELQEGSRHPMRSSFLLPPSSTIRR